jgi:aconitate decarboxylase
VALLDRRVTLASFTDERRNTEDVVRLLANTRLMQTADISGRFDEMHVDVVVTLKSGDQVSVSCAAPLGSWSRPITAAEIEHKAHELIDQQIAPDRARVFWKTMALPAEQIKISTLMWCLATKTTG